MTLYFTVTFFADHAAREKRERTFTLQALAELIRINGVLGGVLGAESWTLSQAYYFGSVGNNPHHRVEVIEGEFIDQLVELELIAIGKPASKAGNGHPSAPGPIDEKALIEQIGT